jgi:hypothetical protein
VIHCCHCCWLHQCVPPPWVPPVHGMHWQHLMPDTHW